MQDIAFPTSPWRMVRGVMRTQRTERGTSDHEDSRRLASGLSAGLSRIPGAEHQREENFYESVIGRFHEIHQQDPHNTQGSYPSNPDVGLEQCRFRALGLERWKEIQLVLLRG